MGQNLFLMSHPDVSLVNILLSITRVSFVQNKCVFCQLRVHFNPLFGCGCPTYNVDDNVLNNLRLISRYFELNGERNITAFYILQLFYKV